MTRRLSEVERLDKLIQWCKNWGAEGDLAGPIIFPRRRTPRGSDR